MVDWLQGLRDIWINLQRGVFPDFGIWSYVLLAVLVATEGPLSTLIGAAAAAAGFLDVRWVFAATAVGNITGDSLWYTVGYLGKLETIKHHGGWLGIQEKHLARLQMEMRTHATKVIIFAKIAYGLIVPTLVAAGISRVPWRRWFPVVFVVETLWSLLLVWVGYHAAGFVGQLEHDLQYIGIGVLVAAVPVLAWFVRRKIQDVEQQEVEREEAIRFHSGEYGEYHPSGLTNGSDHVTAEEAEGDVEKDSSKVVEHA